MSRSCVWGASALLLACCTAAWAEDGPACGPQGCAAGACQSCNCGPGGHCCPKYEFTIEKPPCIKYKRVCPRPLCNPCDIEGYGYFPTCWRPWAYPPNYDDCPVPPPGALASQAPPLIVGTPGPSGSPDETLPAPKKAANPNPDR